MRWPGSDSGLVIKAHSVYGLGSSLAGGRVIAPSPRRRTLPWNFQGEWVGSGVKGAGRVA